MESEHADLQPASFRRQAANKHNMTFCSTLEQPCNPKGPSISKEVLYPSLDTPENILKEYLNPYAKKLTMISFQHVVTVHILIETLVTPPATNWSAITTNWSEMV